MEDKNIFYVLMGSNEESRDVWVVGIYRDPDSAKRGLKLVRKGQTEKETFYVTKKKVLD